jgi:ABC-type transport system involved in multi-copper enzyme maturation permease subunit
MTIRESGLALGLRALLGKELRSRSRGWRSMWVLTIYLGLLTALVCAFVALAGQSRGTLSTGLGTWLFSLLALGSLLLLAFITPALTAGAISGERERRTLELLLVTRASPLGLVVGKLSGSLAYILFLVVASLPAFALVYLFGGVPIQYLVMVLAVLVTTAVAHASIGLALSALLKRTVLATVAAYFVVLGLVLGIPFASAALSIATMASQASQFAAGRSAPAPSSASVEVREALLPPSAYVTLSPISSLASVLPSDPSGNALTIGTIMQMALGGVTGLGLVGQSTAFGRSVYLDGFFGTGGTPIMAFAPWVYHFVFSWGLTVVCVLIAAVMVAPVKPWRVRAARRRRRSTAPAEAAA